MAFDKVKTLNFLNTGILVFIGIAVFTSQFSIAVSSIGAGGLIIFIAARLIVDRKLEYSNKTINYLFIVFIVIEIICSALCADPAESFSNIFRRITLYPVFFAVYLFIKNKEQLNRLLLVFFIFSALISTVELVRYFIDFTSQSGVPVSEFRIEYYGFPITNAEIKMLILLLIIPFILSKEKFILNKYLLILISLPVFISLFFTNSRNAILGLFIACLVIGIFKHRYFLAGLIVLTTLFFVFAPPPLKERIVSIVDLNHPSNHSRIVMWQTGVKMIKDHPVIGFGDSDINKIYAMYKKPEFHGEGSHMHSNIVQILVMFGIPGFLSWLAIMLYIFAKQIKLFFRSKKNEYCSILILASLASMIAFQVSGLTEWNFGDAEFAVVMWFNLGLVFFADKFMINKISDKNVNAV